jgi:LEA14-like dessication related protein
MQGHKNILPWVLGAAIVGGGIYVMGGGKMPAFINPLAHLAQEFKNLQVKIAGVHLEQHNVVITIRVLNPNSEAMEVKSMVGVMTANTHKIADIKMFGDYVVQGNSEQPIEVTATPLAANLFAELANMMRSGHTRIGFQGVINVNNSPINVNLGYTA